MRRSFLTDKAVRSTLIATLIVLVLIGSAYAENWAILVGINDYENRDINDLDCAVADVTEFRKALIDVAEFQSDNIFLMTDGSKGDDRPINTNILFRVGWLARKMKSQDTFIFYFSGHGMMRNGKSFLLSINADPRDVDTLEMSGVPVGKLKEKMSEIKARKVLFIIDACRNDPKRGRGNDDNPLTKDFTDEFAKTVRVIGSSSSGMPPATATLYSCSKGERSYENYEKNQGAFSYFLIKGLRGEASDTDGNITINLLADYTQKEVAKWADKKNVQQTPWLVQEGAGKIVLAKVKPKQQVHEVRENDLISTVIQFDISTNPSGATIYVDETQYGTTPAKFEIDLGIQKQKVFEIALVMNGYRTKIARKSATRGGKIEWKNVKLDRPNSKPTIDHSRDDDQSDSATGTKYRSKDDMKMVYIPAGNFMMGDETGDLGSMFSWVKAPQHEVYTDGFWMDEHEVTNEQYCKFLNAVKPPGFADNDVLDSSGKDMIWLDNDYCKIVKSGNSYSIKSGFEKHPVVRVYWHGANEYAKWVGGRLPTEAEWEKAARGGLVGKKYPNGNTISHDDANFTGTGGKDRWEQTAPVKSFAPNGYSLYDMAGNVYEWCADKWDGNFYSKSPKSNPICSNGSYHVIRGGSWYNASSRVRCGFRSYGSDTTVILGFRVVVASGFSK